ncbi:putative DNA-binding transcriptional regulator YafY [Tamaricihabitans halophyticus]|uniref:Putative DNA-binding transcriptional regulator YafY n=1 Tax=Tamaricihabitans halophyticus TaxID=1262583 RepID=A0A4R2R3U7_9PSEU|nr:WYL domain-containing protein [Tamaricihabitans halophyticus]TCP54211.1 putative DNA-binding transcriptional regulator YafY [Tamaricihabitans halophyticus]
MRAERLMALLFTLQQRRGATAAELADALEVSERTIHRDVGALLAAGVPIWTEQGRAGGIRLLDGWRTRLDGLTAQEATALFAVGVPQALAQLGMSTAAAAGQAKLSATLPEQLRVRVQHVADRFHLDTPGWFRRPEEAAQLSTVAAALWDQHRLLVSYGRGEQLVERKLEPLGLVLKAGTWYLVAGVADTIRTYRVARIAEATQLAERFDRPPDFELVDWWQRSSATFEQSLLRETVHIRLSPSGVRALPAVTDREAALAAIEAASEADEHGWRELALAVESQEVALSQLVGLGTEVEILAPTALRAALADLGNRIAARNAPPQEP